MKLVIAFIIGMSLSLSMFAQIDRSAFCSSVQELLNKAKGQKIMNLTGSDEKIGNQTFSVSLISVSLTGMDKYGSEWLYDYTGMTWDKLNFYIWAENSNKKLRRLRLDFENAIKYEMHLVGKTGEKRDTKTIELYFLEKDASTMETLFNQYYH